MAQEKSLSIAFLYDDSLDNNDGVTQYVKTLGEWYAKQGHRVTYLVGQSNNQQWAGGKVYSLARNLKLSWGGNKLSISLLPNLALIKKIMMSKHFDVLHVQVPYSPFMAQRVIKRVPKSTVVVGTVHVFPSGKLSSFGSRLLKVVYGSSLKRFDLIASVSTAAQAYAKSAFGVKSLVIPNTIDPIKFQVINHKKNKNYRIVFLGRLVKRKGAQYLIKAFAYAAKNRQNAELVIAGDGPQKAKLKQLAKSLGIEDRVQMLGYISESDKPQLLAGADMACFPSLFGESFGIVLIEAMTAGAGVVLGGDNPGYSTVLSSAPETIVDPKNTQDFAERITTFMDNGELSTRIHKKQQTDVKQYDVNRVGSIWIDKYHQLIANKRQNSHN